MRGRIQAALRQDRISQALELAQKLVEQEPSEPNRQQLRDVYLAAVRQQLAREGWMEARKLLDQAERIDGPAAWWETLALSRAKLGDATIAQQLLEKAPESAVKLKVIGHLVDRALRDPRNGKLKLAADLHAGFDLVVTAFAQYEKEADEAVKQTLQGIGLQSPYLEWKLLIRGMTAYAAHDDSRALENWQRLDPERLPAALAAPFRYRIDLAYRNSLKQDQARVLSRRSDQVMHPMLGALRGLQSALANPDNLPKALGQISSLLGLIKASFPNLVPKVANCFYWLIIQGGQPEDLDRFERAFGPAADDKNFHRLQAMVMESVPDLRRAHQFWNAYVNEIGESPQRWPGEFGKRAQATILMRMGDNAQEHLDSEEDPSFDDFFEMMVSSRRRKPAKKSLVPNAETCYRKAMVLAPEWKLPAQKLLRLFTQSENWADSEKVGARLLERFPDDVNVLTEVSTVYHALGKTSEAVNLTRRALQINPLDRNLRARVAMVALQLGRAKAAEGQCEESRNSLNESIGLDPAIGATVGKAALIACEFKDGNDVKAGELISEMTADPLRRIATAYYLAVECGRIKVARPLLKEIQGSLNDALANQASLPELIALVAALTFYRRETPAYRGIGGHEKKIHALLQAAVEAQPPETDLVLLGLTLRQGRIAKVLKGCAEQGHRRFPNNPVFWFLRGEQAILQRPKTFSAPNVGKFFECVLKQIDGKSDERSRMMRDAIEERIKQFPHLEIWVRPPEFLKFPW